MHKTTWYELADSFCARETSLITSTANSYFEPLAARRYNYATKAPPTAVRLVFLRSAAKDKANKTLYRRGRFIWCKKLRYEGLTAQGYRQISFTIGSGNKRFQVSEQDVMVIPHNVFINNNSYFKKYNRVFASFSSVFEYRDALKLMRRNDDQKWQTTEDFVEYLRSQSPFKTGTLVSPRRGLFFPKLDTFTAKMDDLVAQYCEEKHLNHQKKRLASYLTGRDYITTDKGLLSVFKDFISWCQSENSATHPVGIVLGRSRQVSPHSGRELYRVSFAETIYEEVHPIQLEVLSEV